MILFSVPEPYLLMQPLPRAVWEGYPEWERWTQRRSRWSWLSQRRRLTASSGGSSEDLSYPNPWRHEGKTEEGRESQDEDTDQNMLYHNSRRRHFFCKCIPSLDGFLFRCCHLYLHYQGFVCVESFVHVSRLKNGKKSIFLCATDWISFGTRWTKVYLRILEILSKQKRKTSTSSPSVSSS